MKGLKTFIAGIAALVATLLSVSIHSQMIDSGATDQLRQLTQLCKEGLISPEVCQEKQRHILGLPSATSHPAASPPPNTHPSGTVSSPLTATSHNETAAAPVNLGPAAPRISVYLPPGWTRLGIDEMQTSRDVLRKQLGSDAKHAGLLKMLEASKPSPEYGQFRNDGDILQIGRISPAMALTPEKVQNTCKKLSAQVSVKAHAGGSTGAAPLECGLRQMGGSPALYLEKVSGRDGIRVIHLWVNKSPNETFQFFLRFNAERLTARKGELETIVSSVKWM